MNSFPEDFEGNLTGFGGDRTKSKNEHRAAIKKIPVILVHGNAANSVHPKWGMETLSGFLKNDGYQPCEIWAMDYLGEDNGRVILNDVHKDHIENFRIFVDRVREYLDVGKLDIIAHSLGCGITNEAVEKPQKHCRHARPSAAFFAHGRIAWSAGHSRMF